MRMSLMFPTHAGDDVPEFFDPYVLRELAVEAEAAGFDAVHVTEHPFPPVDWLAGGGHHALDPFITLAHVAAATTTLRLHTHLVVAGYRNPFLLAKAAATLDVLSGGRVILGVGAGYLEGEFEALGANFANRNTEGDQVVEALHAAWSGEPVRMRGERFNAQNNVMLPRPVQAPGPPIWIGGNSRRARLCAVEHGDGWSPFPVGQRGARIARTASMSSAADIRASIEQIRELAAERNRTRPLEIAFAPLGSQTFRRSDQPERIVAGAREMAEAGVTYLTIELPVRSLAEYRGLIGLYGEKVLPDVEHI